MCTIIYCVICVIKNSEAANNYGLSVFLAQESHMFGRLIIHNILRALFSQTIFNTVINFVCLSYLQKMAFYKVPNGLPQITLPLPKMHF